MSSPVSRRSKRKAAGNESKAKSAREASDNVQEIIPVGLAFQSTSTRGESADSPRAELECVSPVPSMSIQADVLRDAQGRIQVPFFTGASESSVPVHPVDSSAPSSYTPLDFTDTTTSSVRPRAGFASSLCSVMDTSTSSRCAPVEYFPASTVSVRTDPLDTVGSVLPRLSRMDTRSAADLDTPRLARESVSPSPVLVSAASLSRDGDSQAQLASLLQSLSASVAQGIPLFSAAQSIGVALGPAMSHSSGTGQLAPQNSGAAGISCADDRTRTRSPGPREHAHPRGARFDTGEVDPGRAWSPYGSRRYEGGPSVRAIPTQSSSIGSTLGVSCRDLPATAGEAHYLIDSLGSGSPREGVRRAAVPSNSSRPGGVALVSEGHDPVSRKATRNAPAIERALDYSARRPLSSTGFPQARGDAAVSTARGSSRTRPSATAVPPGGAEDVSVNLRRSSAPPPSIARGVE